MNGNFYRDSGKKGRELLSNVGAYEDLSDCLVRAGYATLRCERTEKYDKMKQMDAEKLSYIFIKILEKEEFHGEVILLAHGEQNRRLPEYCKYMKTVGIISLCGAAMGIKEELIQMRIYRGESRKKAEKAIEGNSREIVKTGRL